MSTPLSCLLLLIGCLWQMSAMAGAMLCPRDNGRPEIQVHFFEVAQVRVLEADSKKAVARFDSREAGSRTWQAPQGARGCYAIELELAAAPGKEVLCLTNDEAIGYARDAQAELAALIRYRGARLETPGTPCGTLPNQRLATAAPRPPPPPAAANGGAPPAFAWPPQRPSTRRTLARHLLTGSAGTPTLETIAGRLQAALEGNGYVEYSYYSVPGGFALATRLERIHPDGRSMAEPERWEVARGPLTRFDLSEYLRALFDAERGHFRVIVFIVTPTPLVTGTESPSAATALAWPREGVPVLPDAMRPIAYGASFQSHALIYEFETRGVGQPAEFKASSSLTGDAHLRRAKILGALGQ